MELAINLFSKDEYTESNINLYKYENKIEADYSHVIVEFELHDWSVKYYKARDGFYYKEVYSCGIYEDLYRFTNEEAYKDDLFRMVIKCDLKWLYE